MSGVCVSIGVSGGGSCVSDIIPTPNPSPHSGEGNFVAQIAAIAVAKSAALAWGLQKVQQFLHKVGGGLVFSIDRNASFLRLFLAYKAMAVANSIAAIVATFANCAAHSQMAVPTNNRLMNSILSRKLRRVVNICSNFCSDFFVIF